jgi:hypothetical protein
MVVRAAPVNPLVRRLVLALMVVALAVASSVPTTTPAGAQASPQEASISRLYRAFFMRNPDRGGLTYWVDRSHRGESLVDVAEFFARSPEFVNRYGHLDDTAFVDLVYLSVLFRPPDAAGLAYWVSALGSGRTTRGRVMVGFSESPEFVHRAATTHPLAVGRVALAQTPAPPGLWDMADPDVLVVGGRTFVFGSTNNMKVPVQELVRYDEPLSENAERWHRSPVDAMPTRPAWVDPGEWEIWAPSAATVGGRHLLYFASMRDGATDEWNDQCIGRAVADRPEGPYLPDPEPLYCGLPPYGSSNGWGRGALDPEVVTAPDGKQYLLVALSLTNANIGAMRLDHRGDIASKVYFLLRHQYDWHDGAADGRVDPSFLENPTMAFDRHTSTWLLFHSSGGWQGARYHTGFARCATPLGPCRPDPRGPFLVSGNGRTGPGGLDVFTDPAGVLRVAYATWTEGFENQVGPHGLYKRQASLARLLLSADADPAVQEVGLG